MASVSKPRALPPPSEELASGTALVPALSPEGHLSLEPTDEAEERLAAPLARRLREAFAQGSPQGLFHLGAAEVGRTLPPALAFWRDFARDFVAALCAHECFESSPATLRLPAPSAEALAQRAAAAPPMRGGEYLSPAVLARRWESLHTAWHELLSQAGDRPARELLQALNPAWSGVGRVYFHLAENKRDAQRPFAFLATYIEGVSERGAPLHRPLGEALRASATAADAATLRALLIPVQRAAENSPLARELVDSKALFHPLAWTPQEAWRFLQEVPRLEHSGIGVRVPDWWRSRPRPQVTVRLGEAPASGLGLKALLDFDVSLTLEGQPLTRKELAALAGSGQGLALLRGQWVEVDPQRLEAVLAHWKQVQREVGPDGLSLLEGMRLMAGVRLSAGGEAPFEEDRAWVRVQAGPWLEQTLRTLRGPEALEEHTVIPGLQASLRPYQRAGVHWLHVLARLGLGACLADDMGLGKTLQVLALMAWRKAHLPPGPAHLVVVPASLVGNWQAEAQRFAPGLRVLVAHPSARPVATLTEAEVEQHELVLTTYGTLERLPWARGRAWGLVVLDEAQAIKNPSARQTRAVKALRAQARIALTGTPVENRLSDLWSLFDFLNPGLLGTSREFTLFCRTLAQHGSYEPLRALVQPYLLRRLKTDPRVVADLPEKVQTRAECSLTPRQAALYQQSVEELAARLRRVKGIERRGLVLAFLMRLQQVCNHPSHWLKDGRWAPQDSGKFQRLLELCETIAARQEKVLVFTRFRELCEPLAGLLARLFARAPLVLHGQTPVRQRTALVRRFQEEEGAGCFVLSLKAGGTGLNLTAATHVVHFDRWWNPAVENQATDRAHRLGQRRSVLVHAFVCRGTVEERVEALLESKRGLSREVLEGGAAPLLTELPDEQLLQLVSLDVRRAGAEAGL
ncbi:MAG TPA: DEAD/DEAH box helicase [Myxococcaceae bacterium]|nr:DEAD/DEAH box helicase [Myxococcaceae bacterium]